MRRSATWAMVGATCGLVACRGARGPVDLARSGDSLIESSVTGRTGKWVLGQMGKQIRINDAVRRTLPASPPSRLRFRVDVPAGAHLAFSYGIPADHQDRPGIEFFVKVARGGREETLWTQMLDPAGRPQHRKWVAADVDLSPVAGRGVELILETRGYVNDNDPRAAFWGTPAIIVPDRKAPLVVVYLVDTLRADHTSPYGYSRDTTPRLAAYAKDAVVFETAIANASWTKPSVASIMTSLLPGQHRAVQLRDSLDQKHTTLAEMLEWRGYATGAVIANSVIYLQGSNFEQGFDSFVGMHGAGNRPSKVVEAGPVVDAALAWLDARRGFPTFLYVHTMDPHVPYTPPPPFDRKYEPFATPDHPAVDPRTDFKEPLDRDRMMARYDGEIAYGDQEFGRFVAGLKERGLYDGALMVFVGDHGEEFQDHGKWLHGRSVFDELIHIPLIVKFPGQRDAGRRIAQQVQEVDILPTILSEQKLPLPKEGVLAGHPLQGVVKGGAPEPPAVSEISHRGYVSHGVRTHRDKYVQRFSPEEDELYFDLTKDPKEQRSLLAQNDERVRQLRAKAEEVMAPNPYRHVLKFVGSGSYEVKLRTGAWMDAVETAGFGAQDRSALEANGRRLVLEVHPQPGKPREVSFSVRPVSAPVFLEGTLDKRPLAVKDIFVAEEAAHPPSLPFHLPDVEASAENEQERMDNVMAPPRTDRAGIHVWLKIAPGRSLIDFDKQTREGLKALGYVGPN